MSGKNFMGSNLLTQENIFFACHKKNLLNLWTLEKHH